MTWAKIVAVGIEKNKTFKLHLGGRREDLITNWMFQCIKGRRDTSAPHRLAFHKMQFQELGVCWVTNASQMLIMPHLKTLKL